MSILRWRHWVGVLGMVMFFAATAYGLSQTHLVTMAGFGLMMVSFFSCTWAGFTRM